MRRLVPALLLVVLVALATAMPLGTYAVSLALFGLAHVAYEARYVDGRFTERARSPRWFLPLALGLTALVVVARLLLIAKRIDGATDMLLESGALVGVRANASACVIALPSTERARRGRRGERVVGPRVPGVARAELLLHLGVGGLPEAREIPRHLHGLVPG